MRTIFVALVLPLFLASCAPNPSPPSLPVVAVSIAPLAHMAETLAAGNARIVTVIAPGESPATFDPSTRRMAALTGIQLYFACGVPMENLLLPRLKDTHPDLKIIDITADIPRRSLPEHGHDHGELDPHLWLDPMLMARQVNVMADHLSTLLADHAPAIHARADSLTAVLTNLDQRIAEEMAPVRGRDIFVFHPAFGYFAHAYGLHQVAIEQGGLDPSPRHMAKVLENIKKQGARAVFTQPQISRGSAQAVARETGLRLVVLDPLDTDYEANLIAIADAIREALDDGS